jgi:hypothetical protein
MQYCSAVMSGNALLEPLFPGREGDPAPRYFPVFTWGGGGETRARIKPTCLGPVLTIKPMPEAEIVRTVQLLDLVLDFFAHDGHWTRGSYDDGNGGHCLVGALLYLSGKHRVFERDRGFADSLLEGNGFELPVPRAMQERLKAIIAGFGCNPPSPDYLRLLSADIHRRCESAWNKDPVFGVIGIQSGPPGRWVHSGFRGGYGGQVGDAVSGDDREDPSGVFRPEQTH